MKFWLVRFKTYQECKAKGLTDAEAFDYWKGCPAPWVEQENDETGERVRIDLGPQERYPGKRA